MSTTDTERMVTVTASKLAELALHAEWLAKRCETEYNTKHHTLAPYSWSCELLHDLRELADA